MARSNPNLLAELRALRAALAPGMRLLGIDPGSETIGLALSDVSSQIASPYGALRRQRLRDNAAEIAAIAAQEGVGGLIIGLPFLLDGGFGPAAQAAWDWGQALGSMTRLPLAFWDERLSSAAVNRMLINEADLSRKKRAMRVDRAAAAYMLQAALDASSPPAGGETKPRGQKTPRNP